MSSIIRFHKTNKLLILDSSFYLNIYSVEIDVYACKLFNTRCYNQQAYNVSIKINYVKILYFSCAVSRNCTHG